MSSASIRLWPWKRRIAAHTFQLSKTQGQASRYRPCAPPFVTLQQYFCDGEPPADSSRDGVSHRGRTEKGEWPTTTGAGREGDLSLWKGVMGEHPLPAAVDDGEASSLHLGTRPQPRPREDERPQPQPGQPPPIDTKRSPKSPHVVAMEEFAALERKLASPAAPSSIESPAVAVDVTAQKRKKRKTAEQVAMEEFAALEQRIGAPVGNASAQRTGESGPRKARLSPVAKPEEPNAEECCGNGCATCVWIGYWEELQAWEELERERQREEAPT